MNQQGRTKVNTDEIEKLLSPINVQVVVMMGGMGTRLKEFTACCPKPMVDIEGKPFFRYQLELMKAAGFRRFVFCVGYRAEAIEEYFGDGREDGIEIRYSYDGDKLLGTGGAIRKALPMLDDDFMVIYGDSFMDIDYEEVLYRYYTGKCNGKRALMTIFHNNGLYDKSNVVFDGKSITLYDKKSTLDSMQYIDYGICVYERCLFEKYADGEKFDIAEIQHSLSVSGQLAACQVDKRFYEIGSPQSLEEFRQYAAERFETMRPAVFLDRDGVINEIVFNEDIEQLDSPLSIEQFQLFDNVQAAIKRILDKKYYVFIVTNQPAAAKGKTALGVLYDINHYLYELLRDSGSEIDDIFMCPHYGKATAYTKENFLIKDCNCRKPGTGLFEKATDKYKIDVNNSYMVGDSYTDMIAGGKCGLHTVFIGQIKCDVCRRLEEYTPELIVGSLDEFSQKLERGDE